MKDVSRGWGRAISSGRPSHTDSDVARYQHHIAHAIVELRAMGMTYDGIAVIFGYSRERIRQIAKVAA